MSYAYGVKSVPFVILSDVPRDMSVEATHLLTGAAGTEELGTWTGILRTVVHEQSGAIPELLGYADRGMLLLMMILMAFVMFMIYGVCMGLAGGARQTIASALKTPMVFFCTLGVCFPVLVILATLTGLKMSVAETGLVVMVSLVLNAMVLACFAPLCAFFALSSDYHFMKLLHVAVFAVCGTVSAVALYKSLGTVASMQGLERGSGSMLFVSWIITYGFVGLQMAWTLRPLIGEPSLPFRWLRRRSAGLSVYSAIGLSLRRVAGDTARRGEELVDEEPA